MRAREAGQPLAHVLGQVEFQELKLSIGPGVFVPRPRTDALLEAAITWLGADSQARVLDLGCGCGALAAVVKVRLPGCDVHASDVDDTALRFAGQNGQAYGFQVHRSDWLQSVPGRFDLVLAYLPHVPVAALPDLDQDYLRAEGAATVGGGADGLDPLRALLPDLAVHGAFLTLIEAAQVEIAQSLAAPFGWRLEVLASEGHDRVVLLVRYFPVLRDSK